MTPTPDSAKEKEVPPEMPGRRAIELIFARYIGNDISMDQAIGEVESALQAERSKARAGGVVAGIEYALDWLRGYHGDVFVSSAAFTLVEEDLKSLAKDHAKEVPHE